MGSHLNIPKGTSTAIYKMLVNEKWPEHKRSVFARGNSSEKGCGPCLGVAFNGTKAYFGKLTKDQEALAKVINGSVKKATEGTGFRWSSIQITIWYPGSTATPITTGCRSSRYLGSSAVESLSPRIAGSALVKRTFGMCSTEGNCTRVLLSWVSGLR